MSQRAVLAEPGDRALLLMASAFAGQPLAWPDTAAGPPRDGAAPGRLVLPLGLAPCRPDHRALRLAALRQVLDHQPGGRWAMSAQDLADAGLYGLWVPTQPSGRKPRPGTAQAHERPADPLAACLASWPRPVLLRRLFEALEAERVDAALARQFPGARADLAVARGQASRIAALTRRLIRWTVPEAVSRLDRSLADVQAGLSGPGATALHSLQRALRLHQALLAGRSASDAFARCQALRLSALRLPAAGHAQDEATPSEADSDDGDEADAGDSGTGPASARPGRLRAAPPEPTPKLSGKSPGQERSAAADVAEPLIRPTPLARGLAAAPWVMATAPNPTSAHTLWYDEWDHTQQRYLRAHTQVWLRPVQPDMRLYAGYLADLHNRHAPLLRSIRRHFAAAPPIARARGGAAAEGDQIDLDQALASLVERRGGAWSEPRPYRHRPRLQRDVCTTVLLDMSGSTGYSVPPPPDSPAALAEDDDDDLLYGFKPRRGPPAPPPRRVIDIAQDAIALMCDGLQGLGDRHAVLGFSGQGRLQVDVYQAKGFDEPWSAQAAAALASLQPQGSTRTGAAIRHAVAQLVRQPARTRVLVVVTDGYPQDRDYGPDPDSPIHGLHDTAHALREAARAGVAAFCISVDQAAHDYLRGICSAHSYLVIDDIHALPAQLSRVYRRLTTV